MDMCMIDVTDVPNVAAGDEAVLIGGQGEEQIGADEVADLAGTANYEILCAISARVPRLYLRAGDIVSHQTLVQELQEEAQAAVRTGAEGIGLGG
jgi:alanine racemase